MVKRTQERVGRDLWKGKAIWEVETGEIALWEIGEGIGEGEERWKDRRKCWDEKKRRRTTTDLHRSKRETRHILSPNKTLYLFLYFILPAKCWHSAALLSRKPRAVFPVCVWQGGSWGLKFSRSRSEAFFDGGMLLFAVAYSQPLETHLWAFLSSLPARSKQLPLRLSVSTFPQRRRRKIKFHLTFPQCTISLNRSAFLKWHTSALMQNKQVGEQ